MSSSNISPNTIPPVSIFTLTPQHYIYETMTADLQMRIHHSPFTAEARELKCGKVKVFALLGCNAALIGSHRRFGTTYQYPLQRTSWTLKKRLTGGPETSVTNYQSTLR
jgi:hypothetical protein